MIEFQNVFKHFGTQQVLDGASFKINPGERVGIVGPNGAGKSTLFQLVMSSVDPDKGDVLLPKGIRIGHLKQQLNAYEVGDTVLSYTQNAIQRLNELGELLETLDPSKPEELKKLGEVQDEFEHLGGYEMQTRAEAALGGLGFDAADFGKLFQDFSGGWQMRAELARVLIAQPDLLLLDEPSNYLDLPAVEWLQRYLRGFQGTLMLISHDQWLLESLATTTVEVAGGKTARYQGGFSYYLEQREARRHQLLSAKKNQDRRKAELERFIERFKAKNTKASQAQSRMKMLEKMEDIEVPAEILQRTLIRIAEPPHCGSEVLRLENIGIAYEPEKWVLRGVDLSIKRGDKTALVGFNGMGKTTLMRIVSGTLQATEGKRVLGHQVVVGYQSQEFAETMSPSKTLYGVIEEAAGRTVTIKEVRGTLGSFGFSGDDANKTVRVLSGGEKIRLAFARLFINPPNLLLLDEPTTHLDLDGRRALEEALGLYEGTVVLVSHDQHFVRGVATSIVELSPPGIRYHHGDYSYYLEKRDESLGAKKPDAKKEQSKQEREAARKAAIKAQRKMEKQLRESEKRIEELEAEQGELMAAMGEEGAEYEVLNRKVVENQNAWEQASKDWEEAVLALEEMGVKT